MIIILDKKNMIVTRERETLRVAHTSSHFDRVPFHMITQMIVIGNPMIAAGVLRSLSERNIPVIFLSERKNENAAYLCSGLSHTADIRIAQHQARKNPVQRASICRWLLQIKIKGQKQNIEQLSTHSSSIEKPISIMNQCLKDIETETGICQFMGYEGLAARAYFQALKNLLPVKWEFNGRNRNPPKDPVNALLSYTYTIAGSHVLQRIQREGLDPAPGFLHANQNNRPGLMLDLLEPVRPFLDRFVFQFIDDVLNKKQHFVMHEDLGCRLNKSGRKLFFYYWADILDVADGLDKQIQAIVDAVKKLFHL